MSVLQQKGNCLAISWKFITDIDTIMQWYKRVVTLQEQFIKQLNLTKFP